MKNSFDQKIWPKFNDDAVEGLSFYKKEGESEKPWFGIKFLEFIFKRLKKMDQEGHSYSNNTP